MTASSAAGISRGATRPIGRTDLAQGTKIVACPLCRVNTSSAKMPPAGPAAGTSLTTPGGEVAWAARVFLLLGEDGLIREDYQLTVKPLAA
jgi:hypothetical protein